MSEEVTYPEGQEYYEEYQYPEEEYTYPEGEEVPVNSNNPWTIVYDESSEQSYYYNNLTYETSWEKPDDYYSYEEVDIYQEGVEEVVEVENTEIVPDVDAEVVVAEDNDGSNWTEYYDETYGTYYYNAITFETTYEKPQSMIDVENIGLVIPIEEEDDDADDEVVVEIVNDDTNIENNIIPLPEKKDEEVYLPFSAATLSKFHELSEKGHTSSNHSIEYLTEVLLSPLKIIKSNAVTPIKSKFELKTDHNVINDSIISENTENIDEENIIENEDNLEDSPDAIEYELSSDCYNEDDISSNEEFQQFLIDNEELKVINSEIIVFLTKKSFEIYATHNYNIDLSGTPLQNRVRLRNILSWEPLLMTETLTKLNTDLINDALKCRKRILEYMGDKKTNKTPISNLYAILSRMIDASECLRDELYCQICKQIKNNISFHSTYHGWQLLLVCLTCFPPSMDFLPYLMSFIASYIVLDIRKNDNDEDNEHATDSEVIAKLIENQKNQKNCENNEVISKLSERALRYCIKSSKYNRRQELPSRLEISSIQLGELVSIPIYYINGTQILVKVHSWTTVEDCNKIISEISGISEKDSKAFSVFQSIVENDDNIKSPKHLSLNSKCRVLDIVSYMQRFNEMEEMNKEKRSKKEKKSSILIYKVKFFLDRNIESYDNLAVLHMYYFQAIHDVSKGIYPCSKQDYVILSQLQNQVNIYNGDKNNLLMHESRLVYMEYVRSIKSYGSFFYHSESINNTSKNIPSTVIIALSNTKLLILHPELSSIVDDFEISKIYSWGYSLDTCTFVIKVRTTLALSNYYSTNEVTSDNKSVYEQIRYFKTDRAQELSDLLDTYSNLSSHDPHYNHLTL
jgi:hypothetical protein